jgi:hypothetical protein
MAVFSEQLAAGILRLEQNLAPGGRYDQMLRSENLTKAQVDMIVNQISHISSMLLLVEAQAIPSVPSLEEYILRKRPEGFERITLKTRLANGKAGTSGCGLVHVRYKGRLGKVSNRHCIVQPGNFEALESPEWDFDPEGEDSAIKLIPEDDRPAMEIYPEVVSSDVARFAKFDITDRFNEQVKFYTFLMPVTRPLLKILYPKGLDQEAARTLLRGYWYPAPPSQLVDQGRDKNGPTYRGESGTPPLVLQKGKGFVLGGPLYGIREPDAECRDSRRGICTAIMFGASLQSVVDLFENGSPKSRKR